MLLLPLQRTFGPCKPKFATKKLDVFHVDVSKQLSGEQLFPRSYGNYQGLSALFHSCSALNFSTLARIASETTSAGSGQLAVVSCSWKNKISVADLELIFLDTALTF